MTASLERWKVRRLVALVWLPRGERWSAESAEESQDGYRERAERTRVLGRVAIERRTEEIRVSSE